MQIQQLMSRPVHTCRANDSLDRAAQLMWDHDCGCLPVVSPDGGLVGMITDRDICMAAYTRGAALTAIPVSSAMAREVHSCRPTDSIADAQYVMSEKRIHRLPIVDERWRLVGLLSLNDIARSAAAAPKRANLDRPVVKTLAALCEPRRSPIEVARAAPLVAASP